MCRFCGLNLNEEICAPLLKGHHVSSHPGLPHGLDPPRQQYTTTPAPPSHGLHFLSNNMLCVCQQSRTYSVLSAEEILELEHERPVEPVEGGWGCFNKPLVPRWMAVILASEWLVG